MADETKIWCPECGSDVRIDEDGCCHSCGATATGPGADKACAALDEVERLRAELAQRKHIAQMAEGESKEIYLKYRHSEQDKEILKAEVKELRVELAKRGNR